MHGAEPGLEAHLATFFEQDYPEYEILFCARSADDAGLETARRVAARYPAIPVKFLTTGGQPDYINAKVASMERMEAAGLPRHSGHQRQRCARDAGLFARCGAAFAGERVGAMCCPYRGVAAEGGLWARLEAVGMSVEMTAGVLVARKHGRNAVCAGADHGIPAGDDPEDGRLCRHRRLLRRRLCAR